MFLAVDTYYFSDRARTVGLVFNEWNDISEKDIYIEITESIAEYTSGEFYKRELPCILSLIKTYNLHQFEAIIIDGFVYLNDEGKLGLGGYLYEELGERIPVIGVAKTDFISVKNKKRELFRGNSIKPLFITATGIDLDLVTEKIKFMRGEFRIPALLKRLDLLTRES